MRVPAHASSACRREPQLAVFPIARSGRLTLFRKREAVDFSTHAPAWQSPRTGEVSLACGRVVVLAYAMAGPPISAGLIATQVTKDPSVAWAEQLWGRLQANFLPCSR